ncbi:SdiA-regulated domain-containing protein [Acidovorax sp. Leaf160]|uniref:SdiA-regulated domain-containing protein n=1 Tax=Acidovorax sp. Leaf160 TaxID=1736280 RepID=UPI0006FAE725|nr:SdiA-regulated domain-containing protein [Acidovorax sp. Leaf160]KQR50477.1 hypothetical protein ASF94_20270 [Acidovorax sp. Leaf160]
MHALRWSITLTILVALAYAVFVAIRFHHVDTRVYAWASQLLQGGAPPSVAPGGRRLDSYQLDAPPLKVQGVDRNLSGLTFDAETRTLLSVVNRPARLVRLSLEGKVIAQHRLLHAADVEGVTYVGQGRVALLEEGRNRVVLAALPSAPDAEIDLADTFALTLSMDPPSGTASGVLASNAGFEGIGYDHAKDALYVVKEHSPRALYRIGGLASYTPGQALRVSIENLSEWVGNASVVGTDLSSVEVDPASGHLLLLSDESQTLVELDATGKLLGRTHLSGRPGEGVAVPQAEGIAMTPEGDIFIVSEPNLFYHFRPAKT